MGIYVWRRNHIWWLFNIIQRAGSSRSAYVRIQFNSYYSSCYPGTNLWLYMLCFHSERYPCTNFMVIWFHNERYPCTKYCYPITICEQIAPLYPTLVESSDSTRAQFRFRSTFMGWKKSRSENDIFHFFHPLVISSEVTRRPFYDEWKLDSELLATEQAMSDFKLQSVVIVCAALSMHRPYHKDAPASITQRRTYRSGSTGTTEYKCTTRSKHGFYEQ